MKQMLNILIFLNLSVNLQVVYIIHIIYYSTLCMVVSL